MLTHTWVLPSSALPYPSSSTGLRTYPDSVMNDKCKLVVPCKKKKPLWYLLTENEKVIFKTGDIYIDEPLGLCLCRMPSCSCYITVSLWFAAFDTSACHFSCDGQQAVSFFCVADFTRERIPQGESSAMSLLCFKLGQAGCQCSVGLSSIWIFAVASYRLATLMSLLVCIQMSLAVFC